MVILPHSHISPKSAVLTFWKALDKTGSHTVDFVKLHAAWVKSVTMQLILWSYPSVKSGDF